MKKFTGVLFFLFRFVLGVVFIYAGTVKLIDPAGFAQAVFNYRILPDILISPVASWLPAIEVVSGMCLVTGFMIEGGALTISGMLLVFALALTSALWRGLDIGCGCFSTSSGASTITWTYLLRDTVLFLMALAVLFWCGEEEA